MMFQVSVAVTWASGVAAERLCAPTTVDEVGSAVVDMIAHRRGLQCSYTVGTGSNGIPVGVVLVEVEGG